MEKLTCLKVFSLKRTNEPCPYEQLWEQFQWVWPFFYFSDRCLCCLIVSVWTSRFYSAVSWCDVRSPTAGCPRLNSPAVVAVQVPPSLQQFLPIWLYMKADCLFPLSGLFHLHLLPPTSSKWPTPTTAANVPPSFFHTFVSASIKLSAGICWYQHWASGLKSLLNFNFKLMCLSFFFFFLVPPGGHLKQHLSHISDLSKTSEHRSIWSSLQGN